MPSHHRRRVCSVVLNGTLAAGLLAACGGSTSPTSPTPTPLTTAQIQAKYASAATQYNHSAVQIGLTVNAACDAGSATAVLSACQAALSRQRQAAIAYDNALRAIPFTGTAATDASHLLSDDAAVESLLEQAATAPSLATIASVLQQVIPLLATAATAATTLRADIGLPAP
jgi:hypothetical protein